MTKETVLVIDDEKDLVDLVRYNLVREGYRVLGAADGEAGFEIARTELPDLILLDRMMPGPDGIELCRHIRQDRLTAHIPVIFLTAKAAEHDRIQGLDAGADDYVTKPFSPKELTARIKARLKRAANDAASVRNGDLLVDGTNDSVIFRGKPLAFGPAEFQLVQFLAACPGRITFRRSLQPGEFLLGTLATREKLISRDQVGQALTLQERHPATRLGEILVDRFGMAPAQLKRLLNIQEASFRATGDGPEGLLGHILVERKMATLFQVNEGLRFQGRMLEVGLKPVPPLGEILVRRGFLTSAALTTALKLQSFMLYRCPGCAARTGIPAETGREEFKCPTCGEKITHLLARIACAVQQIIEEAARTQNVEIPADVIAAAEEPRKQFGRYILLKEIGRGGSGVVHRAWQKDANRIVALKLLTKSSPQTPFGEAGDVKRFYNEVRAIADLDHPNIVRIHDYAIAEGSFYYTMDLVDGSSLAAVVAKPRKRMPWRQSIRIIREIALALDYAHERGVVHRDIKPGNILVDRDGKPWLIDFGIARIARMADDAGERDFILGTANYMPPEQSANMDRVDARSDIYSLGAVLYELASGVAPYGWLPPEIVIKILPDQDPASIRQVAPETPAVLQAIIGRAMARDRSLRYGRARDMAADLDRCIDHIGSSRTRNESSEVPGAESDRTDC